MSQREINNYHNHEITPSDAAQDGYLRDEPEMPELRDLLSVLYRRRWIMLLTMALIFAVGMLYTLSRRPIYESSAKIVVVGSRSGTPVAANDVSWLSDIQALTRSRSVDTQVEIISGADLLDEAYHTLSPELRKLGFEGKRLPDWAFRVANKKNTDVIVVTGRAYTPLAASALANTVASTYFRRDLEESNQATRQARRYAEEKMIVAERDLAKANAELSAFKHRTGFFAPEAQVTKAAEQIAQMSLELDATKTQAAASWREIAILKQQAARQRHDIVVRKATTRNPHFDAIVEKIQSLNSDRIALLQEYTPQSPEVKNIENRIRQEESRLKHFTETLVSATDTARNPLRDTLLTNYATNIASAAACEAKVRSLQNELAAKKNEARLLPEKEREFNEHIQKVALLQRTYEMLSTKYYTLLLSEQATLPNGMLVSRAGIPSKPTYPDSKSNALLFLLLGALSSVAAAIIVERLDSRVHDQSTAEETANLPIFAQIPLVAPGSQPIINDNERNTALLESFRILRNNIAFSSVEHQLKILAVTSSCRSEGKSTTISNLAIAMAMDGKKILLVDADMRRSSLHRLVKTPSGFGLTTVLTGKSSLEDSIVPTMTENVFCLPAGPQPPNPAEILNSQPSRELFRQLAQDYDMVLVDCPPTLGLSDVQVISTIADGILFIVLMNQTPKPHLRTAIRSLAQIGSPLIGLVLNKVDTRRHGYGYGYYYYGYYENDEQNGHKAERHISRGSQSHQ